MYISAGSDFLVQIEPRPSQGNEDEGCNADGSEAAGLKSSVGGHSLRLEVTAKELRAVFRGLDNKRGALLGREEAGVLHGEQRYYEYLLAPDRRPELCR